MWGNTVDEPVATSEVYLNSAMGLKFSSSRQS